MKKWIALMVAMILTLGCAGAWAESQTYTVGICQQMPHAAMLEAVRGFRDTLEASMGEGRVTFVMETAQGSSEECLAINQKFVNDGVDLILANGTGAVAAASVATKEIPVVGASVTEFGAALGIDAFTGVIGSNVTGVSDLAPLREQAGMLHEIFPDAKTVGILYSTDEPNSAYQVKMMQEYLENLNLKVLPFPFADEQDVAQVAKAAAQGSDVIYLPTDNTVAFNAKIIGEAAMAQKVPVVGGDEYVCADCGVATLGVDYYYIGEKAGKMAAMILTGADVSTMEIAYAERFSKVYNPEICEQLGIDRIQLESMGYTAIVK